MSRNDSSRNSISMYHSMLARCAQEKRHFRGRHQDTCSARADLMMDEANGQKVFRAPVPCHNVDDTLRSSTASRARALDFERITCGAPFHFSHGECGFGYDLWLYMRSNVTL